MERSLVLVKPDGVRRGLSGEVIARLERLGLKLVAVRMLHMDRALALRHYAVHREKSFFEGLVSYISSGPVTAAVFEGEGAVDKVRQAMGATDPAKAQKGTIRGELGLNIEQNTVHGSDSPETATMEIGLFFGPADFQEYRREL